MPACPACGAETWTPVASHEDWAATARTAPDQRRDMAALVAADPALDFGGLCRCGRCGLVSVERIPSADALAGFYTAYYASRSYSTKAASKLRRARRRIAGLKAAAPGNRFLDIGCNLGFAVEAARDLGLQATGIEIDPDAVARARVRVENATFHIADAEAFAAAGKGPFDILYCTEVIEHVRDPDAFAAALARLAAPGAVLFLTTPDGGHWRVPRDFTRWPEVKPPEHLRWFTREALRRLFDRHGFDVGFGFNLKPGHRMRARRRAG